MIELENITKTYRTGKVPFQALRGISLKIEKGEFVAIMGPSGSGKSTLLHVLGFLDRSDAGSYKFFGREINNVGKDDLASLRNHAVGFVFQQFHLLRRASALENVELPLVYAGKRHLKELAHEKLKNVNLGKRELHRPSELSGGEQQRVAIARALVNEAGIIMADEPTGNLDSKSEKDIMAILKELHSNGKTIIMVTHEKEIAEHAERIIYMRDGEIVKDEQIPKTAKESTPKNAYVADILEESHYALGRIEFIDHFKQAFSAITSNKMRSFLSMLGILIGVASVIAMLALGQGAKESIEERLKSLGSNLLSIRSGSAKVRGVAMGAGEVTRFNFGDTEAIRKLPNIESVTSYVRGKGQIVYKDKNWSTSIEGVGYDYGEMRASTPEIGRWFTREEFQRRDKVVLLGYTIVKEVFGDQDPAGEMVKINRINFKVIGILPIKGSDAFHDRDDLIIMPATTAMYRVLGKDYLDGMYAEVAAPDLMKEAEKRIINVIKKRHRIVRGEDDMFRIRNLSDIQETLESTTKTMSILLGCIAVISLIVGGIGIMNIMLVSVTERTREIGLRKAVGARAGDIMTQFLFESIAMTISGGLIGVLFGTSIAAILSLAAGWTTKVTLFSVFLALGFSVVVGLFFGLWPAKKASKLDPIEALRYE
ncbi:MAG: ABC transporter permease [Candidatus Omnitrophota bacterium]